MKKIVVTIGIFLISFLCNSQIVTNGSLSGNCTGNGFSAPSCIKGWAASHGTPTVLGNLNKNTWAWLSIAKENSEGIFTEFNFVAGNKYEISFKIKAYTTLEGPILKKQNPTVNVRATSDLTVTSSGKTPTVDDSSELVWSKEVNKPKSYWQIVTFTYIPTKDNSQLWFYPSVKNQSKLIENESLQMEIDDIDIKISSDALVTNLEAINQHINEEIVDNSYSITNPIYKGSISKVFAKEMDVKEMTLLDLFGNKKNIDFTIIDKETINFIVDDTTNEGIYTLKIVRKNGKEVIRKIIVQ